MYKAPDCKHDFKVDDRVIVQPRVHLRHAFEGRVGTVTLINLPFNLWIHVKIDDHEDAMSEDGTVPFYPEELKHMSDEEKK